MHHGGLLSFLFYDREVFLPAAIGCDETAKTNDEADRTIQKLDRSDDASQRFFLKLIN
jgi:hypothetical protein